MADVLPATAFVTTKHLIVALVFSPFFIYGVLATRAVIFTTLEKLWPARVGQYEWGPWPAEWYLFVAIATHVGFKNDFGTYVDPGTVQRPLAFGIDSDPPTVRMVLGV
jgi:hypothetical protein